MVLAWSFVKPSSSPCIGILPPTRPHLTHHLLGDQAFKYMNLLGPFVFRLSEYFLFNVLEEGQQNTLSQYPQSLVNFQIVQIPSAVLSAQHFPLCSGSCWAHSIQGPASSFSSFTIRNFFQCLVPKSQCHFSWQSQKQEYEKRHRRRGESITNEKWRQEEDRRGCV